MDNKIHSNHVVGFLFILTIGLISFHFLSPFYYSTAYFTIISRIGFVVGLALRIIIVSYTLSLVVSNLTKKKCGFKSTFPIVTFASITLLFPFLIYWINPEVYIYADYFSLVWYSVVITIGIWNKTSLTFLKSYFATLIAVVLYWLISVTFIPYGMKI